VEIAEQQAAAEAAAEAATVLNPDTAVDTSGEPSSGRGASAEQTGAER
jgi:hypothetical protein